jgi:hypothetical protein
MFLWKDAAVRSFYPIAGQMYFLMLITAFSNTCFPRRPTKSQYVQTNQFTYLHGLLSTVPLSDFSPVCDCE